MCRFLRKCVQKIGKKCKNMHFPSKYVRHAEWNGAPFTENFLKHKTYWDIQVEEAPEKTCIRILKCYDHLKCDKFHQWFECCEKVTINFAEDIQRIKRKFYNKLLCLAAKITFYVVFFFLNGVGWNAKTALYVELK